MKALILPLSILLFIISSVSDNNINSVLNQLDKTIENKEQYSIPKQVRIKNLQESLRNAKDVASEFNASNLLFNEYKYYQFDSAYLYARKLEDLSKKLNTKTETAIAQSALLVCFKSVGFFNEAIDVINSFDTTNIPDEILVDFYMLCAETYQNLGSYVWGTTDLSSNYYNKILVYYKLALSHTAAYSYKHSLLSLEIELIQNYSDETATNGREELIKLHDLDDHSLAVQYAILARAYDAIGRSKNAIYYRALSAISDIKSCTHETTSATVMAEYMYQEKDIDRAYSYIKHALYDAKFYNSRLRLVEINAIFPVIENSRYAWMSNQWIISLIIGGIILVLFLITLTLFYKLRKSNRKLSSIRDELVLSLKMLSETNDSLSELNEKLTETDQIKDQYIMQSLQGNTSFINYLEKQILSIISKISLKHYDESKAMLYNLKIKDERERIYNSFDTAFFTLFPNFIDEFNKLFPIESQINIDANGTMPMEVRIFALMRLGIDNTTQVADYLNLSVNTLYVYKNKVKSRALVPKEEFGNYIMSIQKPQHILIEN